MRRAAGACWYRSGRPPGLLHPPARSAVGSAESSGCAIPGSFRRRPPTVPAASQSSSLPGWYSTFAPASRADNLREPSPPALIAPRPAQPPTPHPLSPQWRPGCAPASAPPANLFLPSPLLLSISMASSSGTRFSSGRELWLNSPDLDAFPLFPPPSRHYPGNGTIKSIKTDYYWSSELARKKLTILRHKFFAHQDLTSSIANTFGTADLKRTEIQELIARSRNLLSFLASRSSLSLNSVIQSPGRP